MPISAGARAVHVRLAVEQGRSFYVDLSAVPDEMRQAVVADIKALVQRASVQPSRNDLNHIPDVSSASG